MWILELQTELSKYFLICVEFSLLECSMVVVLIKWKWGSFPRRAPSPGRGKLREIYMLAAPEAGTLIHKPETPGHLHVLVCVGGWCMWACASVEGVGLFDPFLPCKENKLHQQDRVPLWDEPFLSFTLLTTVLQKCVSMSFLSLCS